MQALPIFFISLSFRDILAEIRDLSAVLDCWKYACCVKLGSREIFIETIIGHCGLKSTFTIASEVAGYLKTFKTFGNCFIITEE